MTPRDPNVPTRKQYMEYLDGLISRRTRLERGWRHSQKATAMALARLDQDIAEAQDAFRDDYGE